MLNRLLTCHYSRQTSGCEPAPHLTARRDQNTGRAAVTVSFRTKNMPPDTTRCTRSTCPKRTTDSEISDISEREQRVVVTKDTEFVDSLLLARRPQKLLLFSTGNIRHAELEALFVPNFAAIAAVFAAHDYAELTRTALIIHV